MVFGVFYLKFKGRGFGFLEKGTDCTQVYVSQWLEIGHDQPMLWMYVGRESCLYKFAIISKLDKELWFFMVKCCDINFHTCERPLQYHTCTTLMRKCFELTEIGLCTLYSWTLGIHKLDLTWWNLLSSTKKLISIHPKLHNTNLHNVTHSLISQNPREQMFVVQISLLIVTFLSLISQILPLMQTTKEVNPRPCIAPCVNMWSVFFCFFLCHLLNVGICHITREGQVEWTTPHHLICCTLCYSIVSHATLIH